MSNTGKVAGRPGGAVLPETAALALLGCADLVSTMYLLSHGRAYEGNPLMAAVLEAFGPHTFVAAKFLLLAIPLTIAELARRRHLAFVRLALRLGLALYLLLYAIGLARFGSPFTTP